MLSVLYNLWINEFHLHWKCLKFFLVCSKLRKYWSLVIVLDNFLRTEFPIAQLKHNMEFLLSKRDSPHSAALQNFWKNGNVVGLNGCFSLSIFAQDSAFFPRISWSLDVEFSSEKEHKGCYVAVCFHCPLSLFSKTRRAAKCGKFTCAAREKRKTPGKLLSKAMTRIQYLLTFERTINSLKSFQWRWKSGFHEPNTSPSQPRVTSPKHESTSSQASLFFYYYYFLSFMATKKLFRTVCIDNWQEIYNTLLFHTLYTYFFLSFVLNTVEPL